VEKYEDFLKNDHIVMGYRPNGKIRGFFTDGHIVMGYLPSKKRKENKGSKAHSKRWSRAQRRL